MNEHEWKKMQDELKQLQPGREDAPQDVYRFKQRVLAEYERRTRLEWRAKWTRRAAAALTVCAAVCVGVFAAPPLLSNQQVEQSLGDVATQAVVTEFFDLVLQNRTEAAAKLLSDDLRRAPFPVTVNQKGQHMTGFAVANNSADTLKVNVAWSNGQDHAEMTSYRLHLKQQNGSWVIASLYQNPAIVYDGAGGKALTYTRHQPVEAVQLVQRSMLPEQGTWTAFAPDPRKEGLYFVMSEERPVLYHWDGDHDPTALATLPKGRVEEVIANQEAVVAVNFTPQGESGGRQVLFYDSMTGEKIDMEWLDQHLSNLGLHDVEILHALPGNRFRLRVGLNTNLLDLEKKKIELDSSQPAALTQVKYDLRLPVEPAGGLAVTDKLPPDVALPQEKRIDPQQEGGLYVLNGSVESFSLGSQDIKLKVRHDPGRVQVLTIPLLMLQPYAGASFEVNAFDEDGKRLESLVMKIPAKK